jgi:hypothetical protein
LLSDWVRAKDESRANIKRGSAMMMYSKKITVVKSGFRIYGVFSGKKCAMMDGCREA